MTPRAPSRSACRPALRRARGVALVVVLCFVVLLSGLVVAYFSQVMARRQVSDRSFNQDKADELARSALDIVVSGLKQEIADPNNSTALPVGSGTPPGILYSPLTAASMLPARSRNPPGSPDPLPNLVRRSWRGDNPPANPPVYSSKASAVNSTTDASATGRTITGKRWNSHYLLPRPARADPTDSTPVSDFTPPDWVFVTNTGPAVITAPNPAVLGRYAYAIYDEGGLLDVNVAGFPTLAPLDQYSHKTALSYADLQQIGLSSSAVDDLVGWRNYASARPTGSFGNFTMPNTAQWTNFYNFVTGDTAGFLKVSGNVWKNRTDQVFLSRQQLLKFRADEGSSAYALQYLGTFSRDVGAPSWSPTTTSPNIDYAGRKDPSSTNPDVLRVRVPAPVFPAVTTFLRADGTTAQVGEPLLKRRFPLNRLGGLSYQGVMTTGPNTTLASGVPSPASAATVKRDFGLIWNADHWEYWGSTGTSIQSSIATLGSIRDHEPNFFELLKAGILSGSLGKSAGPSGSWNADPTLEEGPASGSSADDANADLQIIRIGANIIDQSDTDSYPTEIWFQTSSSAMPTPCYGIENLPYLQRVFAKTLYYPDQGYIQGCYMAEVWNPHQPPPSNAAVAPPTKFQFAAEGSAVMQGYVGSPIAPVWQGQAVDLAQSGYLGFDTTATPTTTLTYPAFREPIFLSNDASNAPSVDCSVASGPNGPDNPAGSWGANDSVCGLYAGTLPTTGARTAGITPGASAGGTPCGMVLKYLSPLGAGTSYKVYQRMKNLTGTEYDDVYQSASLYHHPDPRTDRFGTSIGKWGYNPRTYPPGSSLRADTGPGWPSHSFFPRRSSGFSYAGSSIPDNFYLGTLSDNVSGSNVRYADPDGVLRSGEGAYATGNDGRPLEPGNTNSRPIILNRPFRTVGELGYAYRDVPWRNLDFFTANSADAALLDLFCVRENLDERGLIAGQVNLNTRQPLVLQAIINAAMKDETAASTLSTKDAAAMANAITAWTADSTKGPLMNRSELLTKAASIFVGDSTSSTYLSDQQIKIRREAALRALADAGQTRTWNLMIDVIAQSGRYSPAATDVTKFTVRGEKRYWLHIAIDRYTGEVIDRVLEPVYE